MEKQRFGCMVCGEPLVYEEKAKTLACHFCKKEFESNAACQEGHYVCDECHAKEAAEAITRLALEAKGKNPIQIAKKMMQHPMVPMHGPEHHYLFPAALLAAAHNATGREGLAENLATARQRASGVPGGICGFWGSCGAGIGTGIFVSIWLGSTPLAGQEWALANEATGRSLIRIAAHGGPRCCKRDGFLALQEAVLFANEKMGLALEGPEKMVCGYTTMNPQCREEECLFYPKK